MNKWAILIILFAFAGKALATDATSDHYDKKIEMKRGAVFEHTLHTVIYKYECITCHETQVGGKIQGIGEKWAHKVCMGCHNDLQWPPTICEGCHVKGIRK